MESKTKSWFILLLAVICMGYSPAAHGAIIIAAAAPDSWCCEYENQDVCDWNTVRWFSSRVVQPAAFSIPQHDGYYIWEEDSTSEIFSVTIPDVPNLSQLTIDYFFHTQEMDKDNNYLQFSYEADLGSEVIEIKFAPISTNSSTWQRKAFVSSPGGICNGKSSCSGTFYVRTSNRLGNKQVAAIDNFSVDETCYPTTTTSPPSRRTDYTDTTPDTTTPDYTTGTTPEYTTWYPYSTEPHTPTYYTTPEPPESWCCQYESQDACEWNTPGWFSSRIVQPASFSIPQHDGYYIWEEDSTTEIFSVPISDLPDYSQFTIEYYFNTQDVDEDNNYLQFSFEGDLGTEVMDIRWTPISTNSTNWQTKTFESTYGGICNGNPSCSGTFYVRTSNRVGNKQVAAIDNFRINYAC